MGSPGIPWFGSFLPFFLSYFLFYIIGSLSVRWAWWTYPTLLEFFCKLLLISACIKLSEPIYLRMGVILCPLCNFLLSEVETCFQPFPHLLWVLHCGIQPPPTQLTLRICTTGTVQLSDSPEYLNPSSIIEVVFCPYTVLYHYQAVCVSFHH